MRRIEYLGGRVCPQVAAYGINGAVFALCEYKGVTTGVSYFEKRISHIVFVFVYQNDSIGLKTAFPVGGSALSLPAALDVVRQRGVMHTFPMGA